MNDPKVDVYIHPNPEIRSFLTVLEISSFSVKHFKIPLDRNSEMTFEKMGRIAVQLVKDIMAIPGVDEIYIKPKEIRIKKQASSSWDAIEGKIIGTIRRAIRRKEIKVIKR